MNKRYEIFITAQAEKQLIQIRDYIAFELCSPIIAEKTISLLKEAIFSLENFPKRIPLSEYEPNERGIRKMVVKNYLIYFYADDLKNRVIIVAVVYARCSQTDILKSIAKEK